MAAMSPSAALSKVLLVADRDESARSAGETKVRRYRLARLHLNSPPGHDRLAHVKRTYD
jgi:hypothetical protein